MAQKFKVKWSSRAIITTVIFNAAALILIIMYAAGLLTPEKNPSGWISYAIIAVVIHLPYLLHPTAYIITEDKLLIVRPIKNTAISLSEIDFLRENRFADFNLKWRMLGSGGVWGFWGYFSGDHFNKINVQACDLEHLVFIATTEHRFYLLSPKDRDQFMNAMVSRMDKIGKVPQVVG